MTSENATVTLYGKADCHLCVDARAALRRVHAHHPFRLVEVDITEDEELHRAYFERIPVVALDGVELFDFFVDEGALAALLSGAPQRSPVVSATAPEPESERLESDR